MDDGVCGAIEKSEGGWIDFVGAELMFEDSSRIQRVDPESMRVPMSVVRRRLQFKVIMREFGL